MVRHPCRGAIVRGGLDRGRRLAWLALPPAKFPSPSGACREAHLRVAFHSKQRRTFYRSFAPFQRNPFQFFPWNHLMTTHDQQSAK